MAPPLCVTFDLEDHRPSPTWPARYEEHTHLLLDFLDEQGVKGTVFVVGRVAERSPALVREVAARGHEIGIHNYEHWPLFSSTPAWFRTNVGRAKDFVEDLISQPVTGFRSPAGTLVPRSFWATDVLAELGFTYSASVLPLQTYGVGFPGCPSVPFRWPSGLVEAPCPVVGVGPVGVPFIGGTFLRIFPAALVRRWYDQRADGEAPWTYLHPYDLDVMERFWLVHDVEWWGSVLLWINRGRALTKLGRVMDGRECVRVDDRLAELEAAGAIHDYDPTVGTDLSAIEPASSVAPKGSVVSVALDGLRRYLGREELVAKWVVPEHLREDGTPDPGAAASSPTSASATSASDGDGPDAARTPAGVGADPSA